MPLVWGEIQVGGDRARELSGKRKESDKMLFDIDMGEWGNGEAGSKDITSQSFLSSGLISIFEKGESLSIDSASSNFLRVTEDISLGLIPSDSIGDSSLVFILAALTGGDISITSGSAGADRLRL